MLHLEVERAVYFSPKADVRETLQGALQKNPRKATCRALLDPIGFFKGSSNEEVAKEILSYFQEDSSIQNVLFYKREEGDIGIPGKLMVLKKVESKKGEYILEEVGGTQREVLQEKKGIYPKDTFVYYDQKHCEATDIPLASNATGLVTVGRQLLGRDLLQTNLRLRGYLKGQDVDFILPESEKENYPPNPTGRDILTQAEVTQAIKLADNIPISSAQKLENIFRQAAVDCLLKKPTYEEMQKYRGLFVQKQPDTPYELFGESRELAAPSDVFLSLRKEKEKAYPEFTDQAIVVRLNRLQRHVEEHRDDQPALVPVRESAQGVEVYAEQQVQQEMQVDQEIMSEYQMYQEIPSLVPRRETEEGLIVYGTIERLLKDPSVQYKKAYSALFNRPDLTLSENFAYTAERLVPVFSGLQKPAEQILVTEDSVNGLRAILVSAQEGERYKDQIARGDTKMWLYLPSGDMYIEPTGGILPKDQEKLRNLLLDVNIFNGNIGYLVEHQKELKMKLQESPEKKDLLFHFLSLKGFQNPKNTEAVRYLRKRLELD